MAVDESRCVDITNVPADLQVVLLGDVRQVFSFFGQCFIVEDFAEQNADIEIFCVIARLRDDCKQISNWSIRAVDVLLLDEHGFHSLL